MDSYFSKEQLAHYLKMKVEAVDFLLGKGQIPVVMTPKNIAIFKKADIDAWIKDKQKKVAGLLEQEEAV